MTCAALKLRKFRFVLWGIVLGVGVSFGGVELWRQMGAERISTTSDAISGAIPGNFSLVDHTGKPVTKEDYRGKWLLVFLGYTYCPDVCPTTLNEIAEVMERLGEKAAKVQPLFITIDPERDTVPRMAEYVAAFDPRIVGLTGTSEQIKEAANSFRVYYAKASQEGAPNGYLMDHSTSLYLFNPEGQFEKLFSFNDDVEKIVAGVQKYL